jgi:hypothetical protein
MTTHEDVENWTAALGEIGSIEFENPKNIQISKQNFPPAKVQIGDTRTAEKHIFVEQADKITITMSDNE